VCQVSKTVESTLAKRSTLGTLLNIMRSLMARETQAKEAQTLALLIHFRSLHELYKIKCDDFGAFIIIKSKYPLALLLPVVSHRMPAYDVPLSFRGRPILHLHGS
jgi:hypothetical protein